MLVIRRGWLSLVVAAIVFGVACGPRAEPASSARATRPLAAVAASVPMAQILSGGSVLAGRLLVVKGGDLWLYQGRGAHPLATGQTWRQPDWSPDGTRFAYTLRGQNFSDIALSDLTGETQTRLTRSQSSVLEENAWNLRPAWSPNGAQIAFASDRSSSFPVLWLMNADGSAQHRVPTPGLTLEGTDAISWAPDGKHLAVTAIHAEVTTQIALIPMGTSTPEQARILTDYPKGAVDPAWSRDGKHLAYAARDGGGVAIFVALADATFPKRLTNGQDIARAPTWSPDGKQLAYLSAKAGTVDLWVQDVMEDGAGNITASNERQLTQNLGLDGQSGIAWSN